ncbi:hypothetical protein PHLCEN_2v12402 [Hermanssonia centrifuga]|uniref:Uncharacterized protein n=1 Tax=Hermanssonia centrifuga TaxID=98765 RepID=A0A2R6NHH3_9APHY|nr:hypothetical protein PHLCEN_2v12402 [Hermanssonia centrifuga]
MSDYIPPQKSGLPAVLAGAGSADNRDEAEFGALFTDADNVKFCDRCRISCDKKTPFTKFKNLNPKTSRELPILDVCPKCAEYTHSKSTTVRTRE